MCLPRHKQSFFAMESVKICRFKTSLVEIFARKPCFRLNISAYMLNKILDLLTYSAIKCKQCAKQQKKAITHER